MLKYIAKRLVYIFITLWIIISVTFFLMKKLPGTPFDAERFAIMTPLQQERILELYGLNDPLPVQYQKYILNILHGDLGTSFTYVNQDVGKVISGRLGPSFLIGLQAVLLGLSIGLILGILAAWNYDFSRHRGFCTKLRYGGPSPILCRVKMGNPSGGLLDGLDLLYLTDSGFIFRCHRPSCQIYADRNAGYPGTGLYDYGEGQGLKSVGGFKEACYPKFHSSGSDNFGTHHH